MRKASNISILAVLCLITALTSFAQQQAEISVPGLKDKVTVRRDERGIPYIQAQNEADMYFAQGYVMAQDRLWQMDLMRRLVRGETAEIFGKPSLNQDKYWRKYGFAKVAEETVKNLPPELKSALDSYAQGVNAYIKTKDAKSLPPEFQILQYKPREWKPEDSIVVGKVLADGLSGTWWQDLLRLNFSDLPETKLEKLFPMQAPNDVLLFGKDTVKPKAKSKQAIVTNGFDNEILASIQAVRKDSLEIAGFYAEKLAASNNWVVSGKKTVDGKPILANDPHLQASAPSIWYLVNLSCPTIKAAGVTFPGATGVILGHNENIAWGATNVGPDVQDIYLETFDPNDKTKYKTPSGWATAEIIKEQINVRQNPLDPKSLQPEELEVVRTRNGVIVTEDKGRKFALKWTAFDPKNDELSAFFLLNRAKNWNEFKKSLQSYGGPMQNFIYADTSGNIGWYSAGRVPLRKKDYGALPYDGATDDGEWTGYVPFEELPNLYNPPSGMIVTANQRTMGSSYKHQGLVRDYASPHRARRIYELLQTKSKHSVEDMMAIQYDVKNTLFLNLAKSIIKQNAASLETIKLLSEWDGNLTPNSKAAAMTGAILNVARMKILEHAIGAEKAKSYRFGNDESFDEWFIREQPKDWLPKEYATYADLYKASEKQAKENLTKSNGADESKWTWGATQPIRFFHPLSAAPLIGGQFTVAPLPRIGSGLTPNVGNWVSMRLIATPGDWDKTRHTIQLGQSGIPSSKHWKDQVDGWYSGKTPVFPFTQKGIEAAAKETVILKP